MKRLLLVTTLAAVVAIAVGSSLAFAAEPGSSLGPSAAHDAIGAGALRPGGGLVILAILGIASIGALASLTGFLFATRPR